VALNLELRGGGVGEMELTDLSRPVRVPESSITHAAPPEEPVGHPRSRAANVGSGPRPSPCQFLRKQRGFEPAVQSATVTAVRPLPASLEVVVGSAAHG
jgi:hypothetical protein